MPIKIIREITYEGDPDWVLDTIRRSLTEGEHRFTPKGTITLKTIEGTKVPLIAGEARVQTPSELPHEDVGGPKRTSQS